mmetsp:Transcript_128862/g.412631  ORF Transcript_128862/g.412631 Transcript_128862/m.412631 type:complete len:213 (+) Transcript_128862:5035-5673(+)
MHLSTLCVLGLGLGRLRATTGAAADDVDVTMPVPVRGRQAPHGDLAAQELGHLLAPPQQPRGQLNLDLVPYRPPRLAVEVADTIGRDLLGLGNGPRPTKQQPVVARALDLGRRGELRHQCQGGKSPNIADVHSAILSLYSQPDVEDGLRIQSCQCDMMHIAVCASCGGQILIRQRVRHPWSWKEPSSLAVLGIRGSSRSPPTHDEVGSTCPD